MPRLIASVCPPRALVGAFLALVVSGLGCAPVDPGTTERPFADLETEVPALMETVGIPGLTIAVIERSAVAWAGQFGVESVETGAPVTDETLFEAASLTKPVFAYTILRLVERGELSLDRPLHELLEYERFAGVESSLALTPRLVLSHQTGLPNWGGEVLEFGFDPGTAFGYSGEGYVYLQRTVEAQTGLTLQELVEREVFEPLGMALSRLTWAEDDAPRLAIGHDEVGVPRRRNPPEVNAAGSLFTTASDYARFAIAMLDAEGLKRGSVEAAFAPAVRMRGDERGFERPEEVAGQVGWGLGWGVQELAGERIVWHWGDNEIFHAFVALRPAERSGLVYFANSSNGLAIARRLVQPVVGEMRPTFAWLGYEQSDDPGWSERRAGFLAERAGDYPAAIGHFERSLAVAPGDMATNQRVDWLTDLIGIAESPVEVAGERLASYAGRYGPRTLAYDGHTLSYQREGRDPFRLLPISDDTFAFDGMVDFRIEVVTDGRGRPTKLVGHYLGGGSDESPRDPD